MPYKQVKRRRKAKGGATGTKARNSEVDAASDDDAAAAEVDDDGDDGDDGDDAVGTSATETSLYGHWQVKRHVPVPLVDGVVPLNAHGNFELWSRW